MLFKNRFKNQIASVFALKAIHQIVYSLFCFFAIKKLNIEDFGLFSYLLAIIGYFPSFALLGLPLYLQKQIAKAEAIQLCYFYVTVLLIILVLIAIDFVLPVKMNNMAPIVIFITFTHILMSFVTAMSNGQGFYAREYKLLLLYACWMPVLAGYIMFSKVNLKLDLILYFWGSNAIAMFFYLLFCASKLVKRITFTKHKRMGYMVISNLILLYSISIPFDFPKFYDRFLLDKFFDHTILGIYAFNSTLVVMTYALFIRPLTNIYVTLISQHMASFEQQAKILARYYLHIVMIYSALIIFYTPFSQQWLDFLGLSRYSGTMNVFFFALGNMFLFTLSIPLQIRICLSNDTGKKLLYCCLSLLIFNIPFLFILIQHCFSYFLYGFMLAYLAHLLLCLWLDFEETVHLVKLLPNELLKLFHKAYIVFQKIILANTYS